MFATSLFLRCNSSSVLDPYLGPTVMLPFNYTATSSCHQHQSIICWPLSIDIFYALFSYIFQFNRLINLSVKIFSVDATPVSKSLSFSFVWSVQDTSYRVLKKLTSKVCSTSAYCRTTTMQFQVWWKSHHPVTMIKFLFQSLYLMKKKKTHLQIQKQNINTETKHRKRSLSFGYRT